MRRRREGPLGHFLLIGLLPLAPTAAARAEPIATPTALERRVATESDRQIELAERPYWRTNLFKRVATDQKFLVMTWWPAEFRNPTFTAPLVLGVALAAQTGASDTGDGWDSSLETGFSSRVTGGPKLIAQDLTRLGNATTVAAMLGVSYLIGRKTHDDRLAEASSYASEALMDAGIWVVVLKSAASRVRPHQPGHGDFFLYGKPSSGSFPSGHAMAAFSVASAFAHTYDDKKWVAGVAYGAAALVGLARIGLGRHYPSDVLVGAVLGASIGEGVVARGRGETPIDKFRIVPVTGPEGRGVGVGFRKTW